MKIEKVINNNIISALDADNREVIVMGRGIGFGIKAGQEIDEKRIEKIFRIEESAASEQFKNLIKNLPLEYIQISNEIISYARENLNMDLSQNVYITLTDHISFAIERFKDGIRFTNALLAEIKRFYPEEFRIGLQGLKLVEEKTGIRLPEDEAASIALHLVTAEFNIKVRDSFSITLMIEEMLEIISSEMELPKGDNLYKDRMIVNLKFLACRILMLPEEEIIKDEMLYTFVKEHCTAEYVISEKIEKYVTQKYDRKMSEEEMVYLALNIKRLKDTLQEGKEL